MYNPQTPYTRIAVETIHHYLSHSQEKGLSLSSVPDELYRIQRGCFVSLHKANDDLRGCIGTIEPQEDCLVDELKRNAYAAAFKDHRFPPLTKSEFPGLKISVDVLTIPEEISDPYDLDPWIFGLIISDGKYRRGILLPSIPGIETIEKQIQIVKQKAGLSQEDDKGLFYYRFTSNRYH